MLISSILCDDSFITNTGKMLLLAFENYNNNVNWIGLVGRTAKKQRVSSMARIPSENNVSSGNNTNGWGILQDSNMVER